MNSNSSKGTGWNWLKIQELAETCSGTTPSRGRKEFFGGSIPWVKTGELVDGVIANTEECVSELALKETSLRLLPRRTVLVAMYGQGQTRGRTGLLDCEATINQACFAILPNDKFVPEFLQYWFRHSYQRLRQKTEARGGSQPNLNGDDLRAERVPVPEPREQERVAECLREQLAEVERARAAVEEQLKSAEAFVDALLRESLNAATEQPLSECLREVTGGIGEDWAKYPLLGATRTGLAPAKEPVGKSPQRYKPVRPGTIFYNPMRILLGSIAMIDEGEEPGITSPDYVVMTGVENRLHARWFYYWFRSKYGAEFIKSLSRGAVRERLLFRRLSVAKVGLPSWELQRSVAAHLSEIKRVKVGLREKLQNIEKIPAALLREAFSGRF